MTSDHKDSKYYWNDIEYKFIFFTMHIGSQNQQGFFDINKDAEVFMKGLLNCLGYTLQNLNVSKPNFPAIDLAGKDKEGNPIAIQVTTDSSLAKIKDTIDKFCKFELNEKYGNNLYFIILTTCKIKQYQYPQEYGGIKIKAGTNVWNLIDLLKQIGNEDLDKIKAIHKYINDHIPAEEAFASIQYLNIRN